MVALLRDRFYEGYRRHMKNGYYPIPDREVMRDIYRRNVVRAPLRGVYTEW